VVENEMRSGRCEPVLPGTTVIGLTNCLWWLRSRSCRPTPSVTTASTTSTRHFRWQGRSACAAVKEGLACATVAGLARRHHGFRRRRGDFDGRWLGGAVPAVRAKEGGWRHA
jgi:hypothetical protein